MNAVLRLAALLSATLAWAALAAAFAVLLVGPADPIGYMAVWVVVAALFACAAVLFNEWRESREVELLK